tara:strand:+ start:6 stop:659 length:654 start_codon:yes stop_codon:yes gene_type:complete
MAFTRVVGPGIHTQANIDSHNIKSTGIITATKFDGPFDSLTVSGNLSIGGTLTYEDVTNVDSVGLITARNGLIVSGAAATFSNGIQGIGIQSGGLNVAVGVITALNFIGAGNTFKVTGSTVDISIQGGGGGGGAFTTSVTGVQTSSVIVGIGTTTTDDADLQGIGNTAKGLYISNGMMIMDNTVHGNHYIGTNFNGLMVGPVNIEGTISIDGNYVVV